MNKKQLFVAGVMGAALLFFLLASIVRTSKSPEPIMMVQSRIELEFRDHPWGDLRIYLGTIILIGGLLIYALRDKKK